MVSEEYIMQRELERQVVAEICLDGCPEGTVLDPMQAEDEIRARYFADWEFPLSPWGGFNLPAGFEVVSDDGRKALEWTDPRRERALVTGNADWRNYRIVAEVKPIDREFCSHIDRDACSEAMVGIIFRMVTSRMHYYFGIEGRRQVVLYRRMDDEWYPLAAKEIDIPEEWVTLEVELDGDGMRCRADALGVDFFATDTHLPTGKVGVRGAGRNRVASVQVGLTEAEQMANARRQAARQARYEELSADVPEPVRVHTLDIEDLGGEPLFADFHTRGRHDLLVCGETLRALSIDGELLWETPEAIRDVVFSRDHTRRHGRLIYGFTGARGSQNVVPVLGGGGRIVAVGDEMVVVRGSDGQILARQRVPEVHPDAYQAAFTVTSGDLSGKDPFDIVMRVWRRSIGGSGCNVWAYNKDLELLWHNEVNAHFGHAWSLQFFDVDGDGRDELLAGGTLFSPEGEILWVHDREEEMLRINAATHYDAVAIGNYGEDPDSDPVAMLMGGSAGVYIVDALTGQTRAVHRVGHAQGRVLGRMRKDLPGTQVLVACRWGNYGILTLFSGRGDRLWSLQPDYIGQGAQPITWGDPDAQLIWTNTTRQAMALYDGYGRRVKELTELQHLYGERMRREVSARVVKAGTNPADLMALTVDGRTLFLFAPADHA
jgi:hypothetical protein